jgi:hypothetical protein
MPTGPAPSASLVRAVQVEDARLVRTLEVLDQRRAALQAELAALDRERRELQARRRLLAQVGGESSTEQAERAFAHTQLKGRELRRVAGRLLWELQRNREIHYREWFEHVLAAGYAVAGKDPAASFLTNLRDSPAVVRGSAPGHYRIDAEAAARTHQARAEVAAEIEDVQSRMAVIRRDTTAGISHPDELERLRAHRQDLKAQLRRLDLEADEVAAILGDDEQEGQVRRLLVAAS